MFRIRVALLGILLVLVVLLAFLHVRGEVVSNDCRRVGETMQVPWKWDPWRGCFVQPPDGSWVPILLMENH